MLNKLKLRKNSDSKNYKRSQLIVALIAIIGFVIFLHLIITPKANTEIYEHHDNHQVAKAPEKPKAIVKKSVSYDHQSIPVLMFHHIRDHRDQANWTEYEMSTDPDVFQSEMQSLKANGFQTITFKQLRDGDVPTKPIIISFDDGYQDNYDKAFKILKNNGQVGVFFIISNAVFSKAYLSKEEIKEMSDNGMEIGSHTSDHEDLSTASLADIDNQVQKSKKDLESITGKPVETFCYPFGKSSATAEAEVIKAGYKSAVIVSDKASSGDAMLLPRVEAASWDDIGTLMKKINSFSSYNNQYTWNYAKN
jgi:peptidoglycan/xylan/chitin deacetylase (PgdA/CDA1 family)